MRLLHLKPSCCNNRGTPLMDFSAAVLACLREVELSAVSTDAVDVPHEPAPAQAVDSNMEATTEATMLMADGITIGYLSKRKKRKQMSKFDSNLVQESDPSTIRFTSISQPASQPAFMSQQPEEDEDLSQNAWHFHAIVIAEKPSETTTVLETVTTAIDEEPPAPASHPSATLIVLRDMHPVFDLGTLTHPSPIVKGIKRVPYDTFGLKLTSFDPGEDGKGSIALSHWTDAPGVKKKTVNQTKSNRYELKTVVIHIFSGLHALSLIDPSPDAPEKKIKPLNPTMEASLVTEALTKALADLRVQALTSEEEGGASFGISKHEERLNEAIPAINKSILSILSAATNVHLLPFALDIFQCRNQEELGDALFISTCEAVNAGILSKSKRGGRKDRVKKGGEPSGGALLSCAVVEVYELAQTEYRSWC